MDAAFRRYTEDCPDAVMVTDRKGRIVHVNPACERLTGYACAELVGRSPAVLKSGTHEADFYRQLWATLLAGGEFRAVFCNRKKSGERYYEEKIIRPLHAASGAVTGYVSFGRDVTERARELDKLEHAATHDSLTDLPNRRLFLDRLGQALRHAARRAEEFTVVILDLDEFRETNSAFGHLGGDAVLQAVAGRTGSCVREADTVARIGGDEFGLILSGTGKAAAAAVLEKIVAANSVPVDFEGDSVQVTVSAGACAYPSCASTEHDLLKVADLRMYEAKRSGGNRYVL
ncbi:MAG: sensor domain-containing diguanylate cyclase [Betaproteobacteria bacterium]|nr:MAG: sensor domain-containing diguanylate cyclase [Betaproteobacteria bacterium]